MGYVTIGGHQIYYEVDGNGPPVLMVMGLGGNSQVWAPIRRFLTSKYTLIMYDMRGTGKSSLPSQPVTLDDLIQEIDTVLTHLAIERLITDQISGVGFSFGATVLLSYARRYPQKIKSISLVSGVYDITTYVRTYLTVQTELAQVLSRGQYLKQVVLWLLSERFFQKNPDFFDRVIYMLERSPLAGRTLEVWELFAAAFQDSQKNLHEIACPMQIIHGTADKVSSMEIVQRITESLPECQVDWVKYGGHMLTWDAPEDTVEFLLNFLALHQ